MEQLQVNESIFGFGLNNSAKDYLRSTAKWQKFLSWVNIICLSIGILFCFFGSSFWLDRMSGYRSGDFGYLQFVFVFYAIILIIILIPNFYRLSFANKCIKSIESSDEEMLSESFKNLKTYSTFWGILTIIFMAIYVLMILFFIITIASNGRF